MCAAPIDHLSLCDYSICKYLGFFSLQDLLAIFSTIQLTTSISIKVPSDSSFASPQIRSVASSGPLLYVQTLISFTSISQQSTGLRKSRTVQVSHTAARVCHVNICHETREHMRAHTGSNKQQTHLHTRLKIPKINVNQIRYICCQNLIK